MALSYCHFKYVNASNVLEIGRTVHSGYVVVSVTFSLRLLEQLST